MGISSVVEDHTMLQLSSVLNAHHLRIRDNAAWCLLRTIVKFTQLCSRFLLTALLNFACDWLALDRDITFGRLTGPNV